MTSSISSRRWIRWVPSTPTEPTDTLVLTSPTGFYVDVRIVLGIDEVATAALEKTEAELLAFSAEQPGPKAADDLKSHQARGRDELAVSWDRLDWAFAGKSRSVKVKEGKKSTWEHWVDSRGKGVEDEGLMVPYEGEGTGEVLELEKGAMIDPMTGKLTEYEELWAEVPEQSVAGEDGKLCVVMVAEHTDENRKPTGMVIRIGQFLQGVLRIGDDFVVERWAWIAKDKAWKRLVRIGQGELPCSLLMNPTTELQVGRDFVPAKGGYRWRVEELVRS